MPYGTATLYSGDVGRQLKSTSYTPTGSTSYTQTYTTGTNTHSRFYTRSGTNSAAFRTYFKGRNPALGHWEVIYKVTPNSPKVRERVTVNGKERWVKARQPLPVKVWKRLDFSEAKKSILNLPTNNLTYHKADSSAMGEVSLRGVLNTNPAYYREIVGPFWNPTISLNWAHNLYNYSTYMAYNAYPTITYASQITALKSKALSLLYERVKNQKVNLGNLLAESGKTVKMATDIVSRVSLAVMAAKKGNLTKASSFLFPKNSKQFANDWLMVQYGIKPLLSDLDGICAELAKPTRPIRFSVTAVKKQKINDMPVEHTATTGIRCTTRVTRDVELIVKYKAILEIETSSIRPSVELGFLNAPSVAWELTPYSFVIDWMVPIGNYLNNMDAFTGLRVVSMHNTVFIRENNKIVRLIGGRDSAGYDWPYDVVSVTSERLSCVRTKDTVLPPQPKPDLKNPLSAQHIANATALLRQLFKG